MIKLLIVEDHDIYAGNLVGLLSQEERIDLMGCARNGIEALEMVAIYKPEVVLMDLRMPQMGGPEATRHLKRLQPQVKVIFLSMVLGSETMETLQKCGAEGYIIKNTSRKELVLAIEKVSKGGVYYSNDVTHLVRQSVHNKSHEEWQPVGRSAIFLTRGEQQVLRMFGAGLAPSEIGRQIGFSLTIIEAYIRNMMDKLSFRDVVDLQLYAQGIS